MSAQSWELEVSGAAEGLALAREVHAQATDARAVAVWRARQAGATLGDLGRLLGMARKNVLELERRGAALCGHSPESASGREHLFSDLPREAIPPSRIGVAGESLSSDPLPRAICVRGGCGEPAGDGGRFCGRHLYS